MKKLGTFFFFLVNEVALEKKVSEMVSSFSAIYPLAHSLHLKALKKYRFCNQKKFLAPGLNEVRLNH